MLGTVAILTAIFGVVAANPDRIACCLSPYLAFSAIVFSFQLGLVFYVFISPSSASQSVVDAWSAGHLSQDPPTDKITTAVYVGRWVFLGFVGAQILAVLIAVILRYIARRRGDQYDPFVGSSNQRDLESSRLHSTEMKLAKLRAEVGLPSPPKGLRPERPSGRPATQRPTGRNQEAIPAVWYGNHSYQGSPPTTALAPSPPFQSAWSDAQRSGSPGFQPTWTRKPAGT